MARFNETGVLFYMIKYLRTKLIYGTFSFFPFSVSRVILILFLFLYRLILYIRTHHGLAYMLQNTFSLYLIHEATVKSTGQIQSLSSEDDTPTRGAQKSEGLYIRAVLGINL